MLENEEDLKMLSEFSTISVIICTYNRYKLLKDVLSNLTKQEIPRDLNYEVLIVDNNSNDMTKEVCEEFSSKYPHIFEYIFEGKQGKTFALNTGIRRAKGDILVFTDDDVIIDEKWLAKIKEAVVKYPNCRAFGGRVIPAWPGEIPSWIVKEGPFKNTGGPLVDHDYGNKVRSYHDLGMFVPCGANMFFHKDIFVDYGNFNEALNSRVKNVHMNEDAEFGFRLKCGKEESLYIPDAIVYHPVYPERLTKEYFRKYVFKSGYSSALMNDASNYRQLFNVPGHIYSIIANKMFRYVISALAMDNKKKFYYELSFVYYLGNFYGYFIKRKIRQEKYGNASG